MLNERFSSHPSGEGKTLVVRFSEGVPPLVSDQNIVACILTQEQLAAEKPDVVVIELAERYWTL